MVRWTIRKNYWRKVSADFSSIWKNSVSSLTQSFQPDLPVPSNTDTVEDEKIKELVEKEHDIRKFVRRVSLSKHTQKLISELRTDVKLLRSLPSISKVKSYTSHE